MVDSNLLKRIGVAVRFYRSKAGYSQEKLSEVSNIDRSFIGKVERGEVNVSLLTLSDISRGLGVTVEDIVKKAYEAE